MTAAVTSELVKQLREKTGAGMMDCKSALVEAGGSIEAAIEVLRKKGLKDLDKRSGKVAAEGTLGVYIHPGDQVVSIVELNSETDFVARNEEFRELARNLAMQVAAMKPRFVDVSDVPVDFLEKEKEIMLDQLNENQRKNADKIIPGKLEKLYEDTVLLKQPYIKDDSGKKTIKDLVEEVGVRMGEKIQVRRFQRFQVGEGVERKQCDFVSEVAEIASRN